MWLGKVVYKEVAECFCSISIENIKIKQISLIKPRVGLYNAKDFYPFCSIQVQEYVRSYIGETKAHKNFAREYLERRSAWKNSMKAKRNFEDDLLTPAAAINPNEPDFADGPIGASPSGVKSAGSKSKKKGGKNKSKDVSHLLAFSVSSSERVNAGELDLPN